MKENKIVSIVDKKCRTLALQAISNVSYRHEIISPDLFYKRTNELCGVLIEFFMVEGTVYNIHKKHASYNWDELADILFWFSTMSGRSCYTHNPNCVDVDEGEWLCCDECRTLHLQSLCDKLVDMKPARDKSLIEAMRKAIDAEAKM